VIFETALEDALYVNWAVPAGSLPAPPAPLALDRALDGGDSFAFVTLVIFRQTGLRAAALPWPRLSFPQCNLRVPVRDTEEVPGVWFLRELMPAWVVPIARGLGRQPASAALFEARVSPDGDERSWTLHAGRPLSLVARPGAPSAARPRLGSWPETAAFFRARSRGWVGREKLRRLDVRPPLAEPVPLCVELQRTEWLAAQLPAVDAATWSRPHSAFLIGTARMRFELAAAPALPVRVQAAVPG
jgi:hypothetical protein